MTEEQVQWRTITGELQFELPNMNEVQAAEWRLLSLYLSPCWCGSGRMFRDCHEADDRCIVAEKKRGRQKVEWSNFGF